MTELYRAILIDPERRIAEETTIDGSLNSIHGAVGAADLDHFRIASFETSWDYGWVDDTGLSRGEPIHAFLLRNNRDPIAGRCLLIGCDKESRDTCGAKFPLDFLQSQIEWLGLIRPEVTWDHVGNVDRAIVTYAKVRT